jgi:hypothetical protein
MVHLHEHTIVVHIGKEKSPALLRTDGDVSFSQIDRKRKMGFTSCTHIRQIHEQRQYARTTLPSSLVRDVVVMKLSICSTKQRESTPILKMSKHQCSNQKIYLSFSPYNLNRAIKIVGETVC